MLGDKQSVVASVGVKSSSIAYYSSISRLALKELRVNQS